MTPDNMINCLTHIFNLSINEGVFPSELKIAKVVSIFKKGTQLDVNNYRPISLLPVVSKIIERIVYNRVYSYFNRNNFFYKLQFGFRKSYGTSHAVTKLVETVTDAFKQKEFVVRVFLNLSKTFDTINYDVLFNKLHYYGIRGCALNWFQSYLSNRLQQVEYSGNLLYINIPLYKLNNSDLQALFKYVDQKAPFESACEKR